MPRRARRLVVVGCLAMAACRVGYDALEAPSDAGPMRSDGRVDRDSGDVDPDADRERDGDTPPPPPSDMGPRDARVDDGASPPPPPPPVDAGPTPTDSGPTPVDAGPPPMDSGPSPTDSGPPSDAGPCGPTPPVGDYCSEVPRLPTAPTLDGVLECGLALQPIEPRGWTVATPIPSGIAARFAYAWRADGVYAFVDVDDPRRTPPDATDDVYCGAGAEIHVDADGVYPDSPYYDDPGTRQFIATAPVDGVTPSTRGEVYWTDDRTHDIGPWRARFVVTPRAGGYTLEAFVTAEDLALTSWPLAVGRDIGIDVAINVAVAGSDPVDCGNRLGQYFLGVYEGSAPPTTWCGGLPFCDTRAFCNPTLVD